MTEPLTAAEMQANVDSRIAYNHTETALSYIQQVHRMLGQAVAWATDIQQRVKDPILQASPTLAKQIEASTAVFMGIIFPAYQALSAPEYADMLTFKPNTDATYVDGVIRPETPDYGTSDRPEPQPIENDPIMPPMDQVEGEV